MTPAGKTKMMLGSGFCAAASLDLLQISGVTVGTGPQLMVTVRVVPCGTASSTVPPLTAPPWVPGGAKGEEELFTQPVGSAAIPRGRNGFMARILRSGCVTRYLAQVWPVPMKVPPYTQVLQ
ncbi:hypothetical protein [Deinococcus hopiensis]|uniref:hypothetical protein n=1 Tax=Deinococcus hopiensis TaxID=309885 RepID=UPI001BB0D2EC|nr:hypothetical protein [Deinococcus hopiensis]